MTARENVLSLYRREGYTFAPVSLMLCPHLQQRYRSVAGNSPMEEYFDYEAGFAIESIPEPRQKDGPQVNWSQFYDGPLKEGTTFDEYGVAHEPGSEAAKHMTYMRHPMARFTSLEQLQAYPYPEFDTDNISHIAAAVDAARKRGKATSVWMQCTIWERAWYLRDMTQLMMDMTMEDEKAIFLLDKVTEMSCQRAAAFARAGLDIIELGDDVGMQETIMMSREMYREWLMPRLQRVIHAARTENPDVLIFYHSCGYVEPLIGDLIEAGVDILNPVQPECMDFERIHAEFGDVLSFNGTLGTQSTMPFGSPEDVRRTVHHALDIAGEPGGLFCCPTHLLEPEVPWANIEAYVQACKEYGV